MPSRNEVSRSGRRLATVHDAVDQGRYDDLDWEAYDADTAVLVEWRAGFQYPLRKASVGLRSMVASQCGEVVVAQRLKRAPRIIRKLQRFPKTELARMEDIGGCRAIISSHDDLYGVLKRIHGNWDVKRVRDYISEPKSSGYRGVHVVVDRDDHRLEIQLRTPGQQNWANAVEMWESRLKEPFKDETGSEIMLDWLRLAAEGIAAEEQGRSLPEQFDERFADAQKAAARYVIGKESA